MADAALRQLPVAERADRDPALPGGHRQRAQGHLGAADLLRARELGRPPADAFGAHHRAAALRPVQGPDPDHAAAAPAAAARRSARRAAAAPGERPLRGADGRRRGDGRADGGPRRDRFRPVPLSALRRRRQRQADLHPEERVHQLRGRAEDRRGPGRAASRHLGAGHRCDGPAGRAAQPQDRRHPGDEADRPARAAARGDRGAAPDADGAHRRGAALARHGRPGAAQGRAGPAAARPQRPARRGAGAHGRGLAERPADGAGPQDGLSAGRSRRLPGRARGAAPALLWRCRAPAGDAAADPRRSADRRPGRSVAPRRARRGGVQRRHEGRAGARPGPLDRDGAARRLREGRLGGHRQERRRLRPDPVRPHAPAEHHRPARRVAREGGPGAQQRQRPRRGKADRAERQLAGAPAPTA